jgi:hypothetical protein
MLKHLFASLVILLSIAGNSGLATGLTGRDGLQETESEAQQAQETAVEFTLRFAESKDLAPIVKDLYFDDFVKRYLESRARDPVLSTTPHAYFLPGLDYNSRLLTEAGPADWQRFYIAANNFLLFGFVSAMKKGSESAEIKPGDMYPASVISLLARNPNLENMIEKKGRSRPIGTVEEFRGATLTLEEAGGILRQEFGTGSLMKVDRSQLAALMKQDDFFKPQVNVLDGDLFQFPKGTRMIVIKTPLGLQLMLAREGPRLKIFWTEIITS